MRTTTPYHGDVYEIHYTSSGVTSILLFRRGELSRGEEVDYETLPPQLQDQIYKKLRQVLKEDERNDQNERPNHPNQESSSQ